jgi:hypothetical protein
MVSGILRAIERFAAQRAWNDPDAVWVTLMGLVELVGERLPAAVRSDCRS